MKSQIVRSLLMAVLGLLVAGVLPLQAVTVESVPEREFTVSYQATVQVLPKDSYLTKIWVPLASTRDNQQILSREIHSAYPFQITRDPQHQNEMLFIELDEGPNGPIQVTVDYHVRVLSKGPQAEELSPQTKQLLIQPGSLTIIDDRVRQMAFEATDGLDEPTRQARGVYDYVIDFMRYGKEIPGWGAGNTARACDLKVGNCTDFHSLFISMCRAKGIPARFKIGASIPLGKEQKSFGYHCWAEYYDTARGWVPVDASEAWKDRAKREYFFGTYDPNRLLISVGRDLRLSPGQASDPVNIFVYPYVEVDGQAFDAVNIEFQYRGSEQEGSV